ncbi:hypothetical protein BCR34DRAFT_572250 [Clohesyomyces aquaticus]|uniref:Uncharacterized protein n=1 Tax=Clohesyomyces aquaticus TaxID=1231657 RepID=A0A1Y1Z444_9PLEO|nr:hypothetical protein BCR34DRAFT_572250 [Clohesyomyces aquaticus]
MTSWRCLVPLVCGFAGFTARFRIPGNACSWVAPVLVQPMYTTLLPGGSSCHTPTIWPQLSHPGNTAGSSRHSWRLHDSQHRKIQAKSGLWFRNHAYRARLFFSTMDEHMATVKRVIFQIILALGAGIVLAALLPAIQAPLLEEDTAAATAKWRFAQSFGFI